MTYGVYSQFVFSSYSLSVIHRSMRLARRYCKKRFEELKRADFVPGHGLFHHTGGEVRNLPRGAPQSTLIPGWCLFLRVECRQSLEPYYFLMGLSYHGSKIQRYVDGRDGGRGDS
jgi:hypothetical protein